MEDRFEWDPAKAASNATKHSISFVDAITVFLDPDYIAINATKSDYQEIRYLAIGKMKNGDMAAVVYTVRGSKRRIITARKVRKNEQREYDHRKASA